MFSDGLDSAPADVVAAAAARITAAARAALAAAAAGRPADAAFASRVLQAAGFDRGWYVPSESLAAALVAAFAAVDGLAAEVCLVLADPVRLRTQGFLGFRALAAAVHGVPAAQTSATVARLAQVAADTPAALLALGHAAAAVAQRAVCTGVAFAHTVAGRPLPGTPGGRLTSVTARALRLCFSASARELVAAEAARGAAAEFRALADAAAAEAAGAAATEVSVPAPVSRTAAVPAAAVPVASAVPRRVRFAPVTGAAASSADRVDLAPASPPAPAAPPGPAAEIAASYRCETSVELQRARMLGIVVGAPGFADWGLGFVAGYTSLFAWGIPRACDVLAEIASGLALSTGGGFAASAAAVRALAACGGRAAAPVGSRLEHAAAVIVCARARGAPHEAEARAAERAAFAAHASAFGAEYAAALAFYD